MKTAEKVIETLIKTGAHTATKFVSAKHVVRATRRAVRGRAPRRGSNIELVVTIGRPNYDERAFIRSCVKAGEPFPVKKIKLRLFAKKRGCKR